MTGALQVGDLVRHVVLAELGVVTGILPRERRHRRYRVRWLSPQDGKSISEERACEIEKARPNL
jgi:hypothetical protein